MGCQRTKCKVCGEDYRACQLENGICKLCIEKNKVPKQTTQLNIEIQSILNPVNSQNDVYYS